MIKIGLRPRSCSAIERKGPSNQCLQREATKALLAYIGLVDFEALNVKEES